MVQLIPTRVHGVLDYLTAAALLAVPRMMGWSQEVTRLLGGAAVATILYSLLTRYELGLIKVVPMKAHLLLDGMSGLLLGISPLFLRGETGSVRRNLLGIGLYELAAALLSEREAPASAHTRQVEESPA